MKFSRQSKRLKGVALIFAACLSAAGCQRARVSVKPSALLLTNAGPRLNLNTATAAELEKLPGLGPALAARIVAQRQAYGPFRRTEYVLLTRGFSERRFRQIQPLVTAE